MNDRSLAPVITRRTLLRGAGLGLVSASLSGSGMAPRATAAPATPSPATPALAPLNRFGRMVHEYLVDRARAAEQQILARWEAVRSRRSAEAFVRDVRARIQQSFGPWPEKTPLRPRTIGVLERDAYTLEKIIFESRPDFPVTANLYLPKGATRPVPGVVGSCGHSVTGKAGETYQAFSQGLARQGFAVLIFDPLGQGERLQYLDEQLKPRLRAGTTEHLHAGNQQFLVGESLAAWRAWDGIRALDYLLTRPEVDPQRIGITGNSGGGTMTTWLCGVESRWAMAAPSCFVTTFRRNLENEMSADTEQCPTRALELGLDHADFIAAMAPKPVILLGQEKDYFDARGLEEAYARLQRLYRHLGAEQNIELFIGPDYHGYSQPNREAMYRCFGRAAGVSVAASEPALKLETEEALRCTASGQIGEARPRTVYSFTAEKSRALRARRGEVAGEALRDALVKGLRLPARSGTPDYRILRPSSGRQYPKRFAATYAVETEPRVFALVYRLHNEPLMSRPPRRGNPALLYISHHSADAELREEPLIAEAIQAQPQSSVYACDVRGIGESQPTTGAPNSFWQRDYFYAVHGVMHNHPYVGQKTHDVLRVVEWLRACGHSEVHLLAKGWGTLPATFAAVLSPDVVQVTLKHALTRYSDVAETEYYEWPLSSFLPGVLQVFDLPDCYRALEAKKLRQIEPWDGRARVG